MKVTPLPLESTRAASRLRLERVREARSRLRPHSTSARPGRAWINGREVGGSDSRFADLARSFD